MAAFESAFENKKKTFLAKSDRSLKGSIDQGIRALVGIINGRKDYFTTSSCSGRLVLIAKQESGKKDLSQWLFVSHDCIAFPELDRAIKEKLPQEQVWLKKEGAILHVCCRTISHAAALLAAAKGVGFKRSGITAASRRIIVEIIDTENMELPVANKGRLLISEDYLKLLVELGNKRRERTIRKIGSLKKILKRL